MELDELRHGKGSGWKSKTQQALLFVKRMLKEEAKNRAEVMKEIETIEKERHSAPSSPEKVTKTAGVGTYLTGVER